MPTVYTEVEVDLADFDTADLIDELESRGELPETSGPVTYDSKELVEQIWLKRRLGNHDYRDELDKLIYAVLGKIV